MTDQDDTNVDVDGQIDRRMQYQQEIAYAAKADVHLWVATTSHVVSVESLEKMAEEALRFDDQTLRQVMIRCALCLHEWEPREAHRKCKGGKSYRG